MNRDAVVDMLGRISRDQCVLMPVSNSGYGVGETGKQRDVPDTVIRQSRPANEMPSDGPGARGRFAGARPERSTANGVNIEDVLEPVPVTTYRRTDTAQSQRQQIP